LAVSVQENRIARRGKGMSQIVCQVSDGLRASEVTVRIQDVDGKAEFLPVDKEFLSKEGNRWYLPVGLLHVDERKEAALVELPLEADSGANRVWVKVKDVRWDNPDD
jgi:hypothetical protein